MKYVAFICFYITMNVICYGGYSMSTILFFIFIDFIFYLLVQCANTTVVVVQQYLFLPRQARVVPAWPAGPAGSKKKEGLPQSLFYIIILY